MQLMPRIAYCFSVCVTVLFFSLVDCICIVTILRHVGVDNKELLTYLFLICLKYAINFFSTLELDVYKLIQIHTMHRQERRKVIIAL